MSHSWQKDSVRSLSARDVRRFAPLTNAFSKRLEIQVVGLSLYFMYYNFRVVTVTPTKQRAQNLCQKLQKAGLAYKRFWFTDLDSVSADEPTGILERIFFTPKDFHEGVLYSLRD